MSWLYSIIFAGLVFSGEGSVNEIAPVPAVPEPVAVVVQQGDETERFEKSYPITANGRVSVSNVNGSIVIEAWDRNEVKLEAVKTADTKEALDEVQLKIDSRADYFSVETDYDTWRRNRGEKSWTNHGKLTVQFKVFAPRTAILNDIDTVNGSVTVSNFTNITKASAVNGNVNASNLRGTASLETVNGEVAADFDRLESGSRISLETVNGRVNLTLPSDINATLKAESLNGSIKNDFGLPVRKGKYVGNDMYGRLGSGDVQVRLESVNGPLTVLRKNDGKSVNPVTDLLPRKAKDDDDDWDNGMSELRKSEKINKQIEKSIKDSERAAVEGMKGAQEELARIPAVSVNLEKLRVEGLEKIKIDKAEIQRNVEEGLRVQKEALSRMRNIKWTDGESFIEKKTNSFPVKGTPKITIEAKGSSVRVQGWDRNEVKYILTEVEGRRGGAPVSVSEAATETTVNLRLVNSAASSHDTYFDGSNDSVRIEVFVPRKSNLKIVSNGEIRLDGVSGDVEVSGVDESIDIRNVDGKLRLDASDALIRVIGFNGELDSKTCSGDVFLEGNFSRINGNTQDGSFVLTVPEKYDADVTADVDAIAIENLNAPKVVNEGHWRFGSGGPKYTFKVADGELRFRNSNTLTSTQ